MSRTGSLAEGRGCSLSLTADGLVCQIDRKHAVTLPLAPAAERERAGRALLRRLQERPRELAALLERGAAGIAALLPERPPWREAAGRDGGRGDGSYGGSGSDRDGSDSSSSGDGGYSGGNGGRGGDSYGDSCSDRDGSDSSSSGNGGYSGGNGGRGDGRGGGSYGDSDGGSSGGGSEGDSSGGSDGSDSSSGGNGGDSGGNGGDSGIDGGSGGKGGGSSDGSSGDSGGVRCACGVPGCARAAEAVSAAEAAWARNAVLRLKALGWTAETLAAAVWDAWAAAAPLPDPEAALRRAAGPREGERRASGPGGGAALAEWLAEAAEQGRLHEPGPEFHDIGVELGRPDAAGEPPGGPDPAPWAALLPGVPGAAQGLALVAAQVRQRAERLGAPLRGRPR
ncbi:hypothetical protein NYE69_07605 [Paenibacillus sp. FSL R5-0527]|uniref:hypothetical protein n=1 Tax=Paenibacillus sp. FSL R5-0527 TaxID=2975321 RepID=UPI00097ADD48|nr:hypothetical protein BK140_08230 [Paenibacillus macerans]